jgi:hypothetical protein
MGKAFRFPAFQKQRIRHGATSSEAFRGYALAHSKNTKASGCMGKAFDLSLLRKAQIRHGATSCEAEKMQIYAKIT